MSHRRSLSTALEKSSPAIDPKVAKEFIQTGRASQPEFQPKAAPEKKETKKKTVRLNKEAALITPEPPRENRSQLTTRIRTDLLTAIQRIALERKLARQAPSTQQELFEQAIELWLDHNGFVLSEAKSLSQE